MKKEDLKIKINLTPHEKESMTNAFFKWSISVGKVIIILTQLIAMGALFYRFILDRQIVDLQDQIKTKEEWVKSQEQKEKEYRSLQKKLANIALIDEINQPKIESIYLLLEEFKKTTLQLERIGLRKNIITFEAQAVSVAEINNFINELKKIPTINSMAVNDIRNKGGFTTFVLNINLDIKSTSEDGQETKQQNKNIE